MASLWRKTPSVATGPNRQIWAAALGGICLFIVVVAVAGAFMRFKNVEVWKLGLAILGPYVTAVGFLFAWEQLRNTGAQVGIAAENLRDSQAQNQINQNWKKNEFLAAQMKEFLNKETTTHVLAMIDYTGAEIETRIPGKKEPIIISISHSGMDEPSEIEAGKWRVSLQRCLVHHMVKKPHPVTKPVRDIFDTYLVGLEQFEIFIRNKLVTQSEVRPYLRYHIALLNGFVSHSQGYHDVLYRYMVAYSFRYAFEFLDRFDQSDEVCQSTAGVRWPPEPGEKPAAESPVSPVT